ncbi:MAG: NTP transferase domain-containing protein [Bacteroidales bacterium]|nr:NTP transferase domain-containing protein [Bacteroidales bacterium]
MQIILLSGGSGTRLWPLSNDSRSKQFLRLLPKENSEERESMLQRVVRQIREANLNSPITIATSITQYDAITSQIGEEVDIVTEPERRNTFPAICLACEFLSKVKKCADDEVVVVMPCDPFTDRGYFSTISKIGKYVSENLANLIFMGIHPTYPSSKYGYIIPSTKLEQDTFSVRKFIEKPNTTEAEKLISNGALWNGGVFGFKLGYLTQIARKYVESESFDEIRNRYNGYPKISFDYEVAEKASSTAVTEFNGKWYDLGTWNTLVEELKTNTFGNITTDGKGKNTHIINELDIPLMCIGTSNLVIAASPDGILITEKNLSENIKEYADKLKRRPMYEERRWGTYKVMDLSEYPDGFFAMTRLLKIKAGTTISYTDINSRKITLNFIDGQGEIQKEDTTMPIQRGLTISIPKNLSHSIKASTDLSVVEVITGSDIYDLGIPDILFM